MNPELLSQIRAKAQERIGKRLYNDAAESDTQLRDIGEQIKVKCGCKVAFGPIKGQDRARQKVADDYKGDWFELKMLSA